jgi:hypothetical protein
VPFITLLVGASFALTNVTSHRYVFRKTKKLSKEEIADIEGKTGLKFNPTGSAEEVHEELAGKIDLSDYQNLRISRPWEEETEIDRKRQKNKKIKSISDIKREEEDKIQALKAKLQN